MEPSSPSPEAIQDLWLEALDARTKALYGRTLALAVVLAILAFALVATAAVGRSRKDPA